MSKEKISGGQIIFKLMCVLFVFAAIAGIANVAVIMADNYGSEPVRNVLVYSSWGFVIAGMLVAAYIYYTKKRS